MPHFDVHGTHQDGRTFEQPLDADDRIHAVTLAQKAWPFACFYRVEDDPIAGYDAITGEVLFEDDEFTIDYEEDGAMLLKRTIDTTAEDAR